jgi:predicted RNA binding protein YcfA (HicA-like mRNA interferase family)
MSRIEKLIRSFLSYPSEVFFTDVKRLLEYYEYEEVRSSGSHHIFRHKDGDMITVPKKHGQKVKKIYIKKIVQKLGLED